MSRKSFLFFALVFVFALVLAGPVSARQIVGGGGTSDEVTLTQLSVNRAGLNIVFAGGIAGDTEGLAIFVNGHLYECTQTSLNSIYCVGYFDRSWDAISITAFTLLGSNVSTLVLDVDVPMTEVGAFKEAVDDKVVGGKDASSCEEIAFGDDEDCSEEEPTFCELNPEDPTCAEEPTFCELNPMDITCGGPTFCDLNPMDPTCDGPSYCEVNPMDPICGGPTYCEVNPTDPICAGPSFCDLNPADPTCGGGDEPTFCELNPEDLSCGGGGTPVDCELHPEDPSCSY